MKWLMGALVCAVGIIGVETYLLFEKPVPPPPLKAVIIVPPPQAVVTHATARPRPVKPHPIQAARETQRPFEMPTGGIFSGADPQDPRIYHFSAE